MGQLLTLLLDVKLSQKLSEPKIGVCNCLYDYTDFHTNGCITRDEWHFGHIISTRGKYQN